MKKKILSVVLGATMILSLMGCGASTSSTETTSSDQATTDSSAMESTKTEAELTFAWWGNQTRNERTQAVLELYEANNAGITFDSQPAEWSDYWTKLSTLAAGNSLPECIQMDYSYLEQYVSSGLLVDLNPYIESGVLDVSNVDEGILEAGSIDGKLYAVCAGVNAPSLFYNKTLLDDLGITVKDNMTVEEFKELSRQVYEKSGVKADLPYSASDNYLPYILRSEGITKLFNADSLNVADDTVFVEYFNLYETGITEGWVVGADVHAELTANSVEQSPLVYYSTPATQSWCGYFWSNQLAAVVAAAPEGTEIGITTWPSDDNKQSNFLKPGQFFAVSRDAGSKEEEAVKVINYLLNSVEANEILLAERGVPASSVVADAIAPLLSVETQLVTTYINEVVTPNSSAISPAIPSGANEVYNYANQLIDKVLYKEITAEAASKELYLKGNEIMGRQ